MINPSTIEQSIGLTTFYSKQQGIGGILRYQPEDFIVKERSLDFSEDPKGRFLLIKVTAKNWETNDLIREFAKRLHISKKRISFAGTKDKRAITTQILCFYNVTKEQLEPITISDVNFDILQYTRKKVRIGDLKGNDFSIVIRNVSSTIEQNDLDMLIKPFQSMQGFPNFFGVQRFGGIRPITHKVGRAMVNADFKKAVLIYLTERSEFEGEDATVARKELAEHMDVKKAFHEFPNRLRFEKIMLQHLDKNPDDYPGALKQLPKNLLTMFVYAFQSYLFNLMLSCRIKKEIPLNQAVVGDMILPMTHDGVNMNLIMVSDRNVEKVNQQIKKGKATVSCILPGSETTYANGEMGKIQQDVIKKEQVDIRDFIIPEIPPASSYGTYRSILSPIYDLSAEVKKDEFHHDHQKIVLSFSLLKGSYATSFLREMMKAEDITRY